MKSGINVQESRIKLILEQIHKSEQERDAFEGDNKAQERTLLFGINCDEKIRFILDRRNSLKPFLTEIHNES